MGIFCNRIFFTLFSFVHSISILECLKILSGKEEQRVEISVLFSFTFSLISTKHFGIQRSHFYFHVSKLIRLALVRSFHAPFSTEKLIQYVCPMPVYMYNTFFSLFKCVRASVRFFVCVQVYSMSMRCS